MIQNSDKRSSYLGFSIKIGLLLLVGFSASAFFKSTEEVSTTTDAYQGPIASLVSRYLERFHYQRYPLDDTVSKKALNTFIDDLDPSKLFFLESDVQSWKKYENQLDDDLRANPVRLEVPLTIFKVLRKRVEERVASALELIEKPMDFTVDETFAYSREKAPWPKTKAEADDLWRRRIKEEVLLFKLRDKPEKDQMDVLKKRYQRLLKNQEELDEADIIETFLTSLASTYDPHSAYMKPASKDNFDIQMGHSLEGIGATLGTEGEYTFVQSVMKGSPADKSAKIHANDKIIAIAQEGASSEDVIDMRLDKVVRKIRGPKGSKVTLTILPSNATSNGEAFDVVLIRDVIELKSQDAKAEVITIDGENGKSRRVGVINLPSFYLDSQAKYQGNPNYKSTTRDVQRLIAGLEKEGVEGIVMDLRTNGGGSLDESIKLTGLFIDYGPVVQVKDYAGKVDVEMDPDPAQVYKGPLLVLTSVFSASASEIFASAIQDYGRGLVVGGQTTHGKGTVQNIAGLQSWLNQEINQDLQEDVAGAIKLTTHKFYRISGGSTQFKGVHPDLVLPSPYDGLKVTEEELKYALPWDTIEPVAHKDYDLVKNVLPFVTDKSQKRVAANLEFQIARQNTERLEKIQAANSLSLNLEKRRKEQAEDKALETAQNEQRKKQTSLILKKAPLFPEEAAAEPAVVEDSDPKEEKIDIPDYVLDESLLILRDYITLQGQLRVGAVPSRDSL